MTDEFIDFVEKKYSKLTYKTDIVLKTIDNAIKGKDFTPKLNYEIIEEHRDNLTKVWEVLEEYFKLNISQKEKKGSDAISKIAKLVWKDFLLKKSAPSIEKENYPLVFETQTFSIHNPLFQSYYIAKYLLQTGFEHFKKKEVKKAKFTQNILALLFSSKQVKSDELSLITNYISNLRGYKQRYASYLSLFCDPSIHKNESIISQIHSDKDHRVRILIIEIYKKEEIDFLERIVSDIFLNDKESSLRLAGFQELVFRIDDEVSVKDIILKGIEESDFEIRENALKLAEQFGIEIKEKKEEKGPSDEEIENMIKKTRQKAAVRDKAIEKMAEIKHPKIKAFLLQHLIKGITFNENSKRLMISSLKMYLDDPEVVKFYVDRCLGGGHYFYNFLELCRKVPSENIGTIFEGIHEFFDVKEDRVWYDRDSCLKRLSERNLYKPLMEREDIDQITEIIISNIEKETIEEIKKIYQKYKIYLGIMDENLYATLLKELSEFVPVKFIPEVFHGRNARWKGNWDKKERFYELMLYISQYAINQDDPTPIELIKPHLLVGIHLFSTLYPITKLLLHFNTNNKEIIRKLLFYEIPDTYCIDKIQEIYQIALDKKIINRAEYFEILSSIMFKSYLSGEYLIQLIKIIKEEFPEKETELNHLILKSSAEIYGFNYIMISFGGLKAYKLTKDSHLMGLDHDVWKRNYGPGLKHEYFSKHLLPTLRNNADNLLDFLVFNVIHAKHYWEWYADRSDGEIKTFLNGTFYIVHKTKTEGMFKLPCYANIFFVYALELICDIPSIRERLLNEYFKLFEALLEDKYEIVEKIGKELYPKIKIENPVLKKTISKEVINIVPLIKIDLIKFVFKINPEYLRKNIKLFLTNKVDYFKGFAYKFAEENELTLEDPQEQLILLLKEILEDTKVKRLRSLDLYLSYYGIEEHLKKVEKLIEKLNISIKNIYHKLTNDMKLIVILWFWRFPKPDKEKVLLNLLNEEGSRIKLFSFLVISQSESKETIQKGIREFLALNNTLNEKIKILKTIRDKSKEERGRFFVESIIIELFKQAKKSGKVPRKLKTVYFYYIPKPNIDDLKIAAEIINPLLNAKSKERRKKFNRYAGILAQRFEKFTTKQLEIVSNEKWMASTIGTIVNSKAFYGFTKLSKSYKKITTLEAFQEFLKKVKPSFDEIDAIWIRHLQGWYNHYKGKESHKINAPENEIERIYLVGRQKDFMIWVNSYFNRKAASPILGHYLKEYFRFRYFFIEKVGWEKILKHLPNNKENKEWLSKLVEFISNKYDLIKDGTITRYSGLEILINYVNIIPFHPENYRDLLKKIIKNNDISLVSKKLQDYDKLIEFGLAKDIFQTIIKKIDNCSFSYEEGGKIKYGRAPTENLKFLEWVGSFGQHIPEKKEDLIKSLLHLQNNCHQRTIGVINSALKKLGYYS